MKLPIGDNIKALRRKHALTQEQLAERLQVSAQSVSRWELGVCYPDMELLPGIAHFLDVSLDELLGMSSFRSREFTHAIYTRVFDLERAAQWSNAVAVLRDALTRYPNDPGFLAELALALTHLDTPEARSEAIHISQCLLDNHANEKIGHTIRANLCFLYQSDGNTEKALALARTLPHIWESREILLPALSCPEAQQTVRLRSLNIAAQVLADLCAGRDIVFSLGYSPNADIDLVSAFSALPAHPPCES